MLKIIIFYFTAIVVSEIQGTPRINIDLEHEKFVVRTVTSLSNNGKSLEVAHLIENSQLNNVDGELTTRARSRTRNKGERRSSRIGRILGSKKWASWANGLKEGVKKYTPEILRGSKKKKEKPKRKQKQKSKRKEKTTAKVKNEEVEAKKPPEQQQQI